MPNNDKENEKRSKRIRIAIAVFAGLFILGAVACAICTAVLKKDVLFIPMALCGALALILFTYSRNAGR